MKPTGRVKHEVIIRAGSRGFEEGRVNPTLVKERKKDNIIAYMLEPFLFRIVGASTTKVEMQDNKGLRIKWVS